MTSSEPAFDAVSLKHVEHLYRSQLAEDPADPLARVSLAWCLFMQALLRAGQESVLQALVERGTAAEELSLEPAVTAAQADPGAGELLEDCLRQTMAVKQISADPQVQRSAERLLALVRLSGGSPALTAAEEAAARILGDVTGQVLGRSRRGELRRIPTRKPPA